MPKEAHVVVDSIVLTQAQTTSVRVAVSSFLMQLNDPEQCRLLGPIADGYRARMREVEALLVRSAPGATLAPRK